MASQVSPGVVTRVEDFSDYAQRTSSTICALVGKASRGPFTPTVVTSENELIETFGLPIVDGGANAVSIFGAGAKVATGLVQAGIQYLRYGNQLVCQRVQASSGTASLSFTLYVGAAAVFSVSAVTSGSWANSISFRVKRPSNGDYVNYFRLEVLLDGVVKEIFDNLTVNNTGDYLDYYIETIVNGRGEGTGTGSSYIRVSNIVNDPFTMANETVIIDSSGASSNTTDLNTDASGAAETWTPGADGTVTKADVITAINNLKKQSYDFNLIAVPGANFEFPANSGGADPDLDIIRALVALCEERDDCFALLDPDPAAASVSSAKAFINGTFGGGSSGSINSRHAAFYWPWLSAYDSRNKTTAWFAPSCFVSAVYARSDSLTQPWFAPAGFNRGLIPYASDVQTDATELGDREQLYAPGQCVNPIVNFASEGITVYGIKTTQRKPTALDRVPVSRMLLYVTKVLKVAARVVLFEPHDPLTWRRLTNLVSPIFKQVADTRGLYDFRVICDATTNTPTLIDQGVVTCKVLLKPTKTAEVIDIPITLTNTGASFSDFVS